jgi:hypothetical protein
MTVKLTNTHHLIHAITSIATDRGFNLTPIHILKYVYLADLFHARDNNGKTFTGIGWKFHSFGPYEYSALMAINESSQQGLLQSKQITSLKSENDFAIYFVKSADTPLVKSIERKFSARAWSNLQSSIKKHGSNTSSLLHFVYFNTEPMENAVPGEELKFELAAWPAVEEQSKLEPANKKILSKARELVSKIKGPQLQLVSTSLTPDQQKVLAEGISWLNEAEEFQTSISGTADISKLLKTGN